MNVRKYAVSRRTPQGVWVDSEVLSALSMVQALNLYLNTRGLLRHRLCDLCETRRPRPQHVVYEFAHGAICVQAVDRKEVAE